LVALVFSLLTYSVTIWASVLYLRGSYTAEAGLLLYCWASLGSHWLWMLDYFL
jgi:hypothetical protein